jgi:hypothetical protein
MKEQKNSIGMRKGDNPPLTTKPNPSQTSPRTHFSKMKNEIGLGIGSAAYLLYSALSFFVMLYFITDCSVGNKLSNVLGCCDLL